MTPLHQDQILCFMMLSVLTVQLTNINPATIDATHSNVEALSFLTNQVSYWHSTVLHDHLPGWLTVPAHL